MPLLFSYGTLQQVAVQTATFRRVLGGVTDALPGYTTAIVSFNGREHTNAVPGDDRSVLAGTVFEVTQDELRLADAYEARDGYARTEVTLRSGRRAWIYAFGASR